MTPEGKVKKKVTALLRRYEPDLWFFMPVPGVYGAATLDYIGWFKGAPFVIETKAPGKKPTDRQEIALHKTEYAGAAAFVIDGDEGVKELEQWCEYVSNHIKSDRGFTAGPSDKIAVSD